MAQIVCLFQARDSPLSAQDIHDFCDARPILHSTHGMTQDGHKPCGLDSCCSVLGMQGVYDSLYIPW
jgi:hypothetical protein